MTFFTKCLHLFLYTDVLLLSYISVLLLSYISVLLLSYIGVLLLLFMGVLVAVLFTIRINQGSKLIFTYIRKHKWILIYKHYT